MATTDVARVSHDWARRYTGVAPQQGRVTLEAEENEERVLLAEERRLELLDLIGPAATPDDGYAISPGPNTGDFIIGPGTMYVGGLRVELEQATEFVSQPDWLDFDTDLDFGATAAVSPDGQQHVTLVLVEDEVTATEDPVLREVALGGPDGAARTRLLQRIVPLPTTDSDCASAQTDDADWWSAAGLAFDPATARVNSLSRLQVGFDEQPGDDPCQPTAKGGYLGADNQAIRVKVSAMNPDGSFDLLWGWDNASFLYQVTPDASANPVLTLDRSPVDDYHRPAAGQAVEVLRATAELQSTDGFVEGYVAALSGAVGVLAAPYDPDTKTLQFPSPLPVQYLDEQTPQLFLRVWQGLIPSQQFDTEISLPGTGLNVTLTPATGSVLHSGDFWTIGVRPETPQNVLPARLLREPQPPDGPRMWACPLAVIGWQDGAFELLDDCRVPFPECDGGCCTVSVRPEQAGSLQALIDAAALRRRPPSRANRIAVCLSPGRYVLSEPLRLGHGHSHLVLEGCHDGVVMTAATGSDERFVQGLIELVHADNVTISGIEFELPQAPARSAGVVAQMAELKAFKSPVQALYRNLYASVGIRPVHCAELEVERCLFRFRVGDATAGDNGPRNVFGVGIYAGSECWGMRVERCRFLYDVEHLRPRPVQLVQRAGEDSVIAIGQDLEPSAAINAEKRAAFAEAQPEHMLVGILLGPNLLYHGKATTGTGTELVELNKLPSGALLRALLTRGRITGNEFSGLTVGIYLVAQIGELRIEDNSIRSCYGGIWLGSDRAQAYADIAGDYTQAADLARLEPQRGELVNTVAAAAADAQTMKLSVLSRTYPLPAGFNPTGKDRMIAAHVAAEAHKANQLAWMKQFVTRALEPFQTAAAGADEAPAAPADQPAPPAKSRSKAKATATAGTATATDANVAKLHTLLSQYELGAAFSAESRWLELRVAGNDIECAAPFDQEAGPALRVWEGEQPAGSALINDNRLTTTGARAVMIVAVPVVICSANMVWASVEHGYALSLLACQQINVMSNISGAMQVPLRTTQQPPIDSWPPLNTVV
jgi:hypothetical protein